MRRQRVYSGTQWEEKVAYCRALKVGPSVFVAGTTAVDENLTVVAPDDMGSQARFIFEKIGRALSECGASLRDVVRTRMFVTDISRFEEVAMAHRQFFEGIDPVATCVEVQRLVNPELLIEIEVDAILVE
ncbi:MAG: RidA family protein [Planctomycetes bacterium]|nr:RidA family protein [Planctomycetota bacterium]